MNISLYIGWKLEAPAFHHIAKVDLYDCDREMNINKLVMNAINTVKFGRKKDKEAMIYLNKEVWKDLYGDPLPFLEPHLVLQKLIEDSEKGDRDIVVATHLFQIVLSEFSNDHKLNVISYCW